MGLLLVLSWARVRRVSLGRESCGPYGCHFFLQGLPFLYTFPFLQVCYVFNVNLTDSFDDRRSQCRLI